MKSLVIDFGGTLTKFCLMDENANITCKNELPSPLVGVDTFTQFTKNLYEQYKDEIEGVAISIPGMIDVKTGVLKGGGAFLDLYGKSLYDLIRSVVPVPFTVENDGKCGALAEVWKGSLHDVNDGVVVIIGTGDAGGIIKDRRIHRGFNNAAGEISYLMSKPGVYGMQNMVCMHAAMMGLTMKAAAAKGYDRSSLESGALRRDDMGDILGVKDEPKSEKPAENVVVDGRLVFKWLDEGDPAICAIYDEFIQNLGTMLFNLQVTFDPEKIALGGGISKEARLLPDIQAELDRIQQPLAQFAPPTVTLVPCKYLGDANLVGAMFNYMQTYHPDMVD